MCRRLVDTTTPTATEPHAGHHPLKPKPPPPLMPEAHMQNTQHPTQQPQPTASPSLQIMQINLNKSKTTHQELINSVKSKNWDIILIQEPHINNNFGGISTPTNYRPVFPEDRGRNGMPVRSVIWVSSLLETKSWENINVPNTNDITAIQLRGTYGKLTIFNIYNDCTHSNSETTLRTFLQTQGRRIIGGNDDYMLWAGDFNRHHPLWDRDEDTCLFTRQAQRDAEKLIELLAEHDMAMTLPKDIPTLHHMSSKRYSCPDNVFCTPNLRESITRCEVDASPRPTCTDHLTIPQGCTPSNPNYNFRDVDWELFRKTLKTHLSKLPPPDEITTAEQLNKASENLTHALQNTIASCVKRSNPRPDTKRWWNGDLTAMRKELNKLRADSNRNRALTDHTSHNELRRKSNTYGEAILLTKKQHWENYLEEMTPDNIWTANKYLKEPIGDGGNPRIPTLRIKDEQGTETKVNDNRDKANLFAASFFPPPPVNTNVPANFTYPQPIPDPPQITKAQIENQVRRLSHFSDPFIYPSKVILIQIFK